MIAWETETPDPNEPQPEPDVPPSDEGDEPSE